MTAAPDTDNGGDEEVGNGKICRHVGRVVVVERRQTEEKHIEDYGQCKPSPAPKESLLRKLGYGGVNAFVHWRRVATPNDPKLSDRGGAARHLPHGWNVGQMPKLSRRVERRVAGAVTRRSGSLQRMVRPFVRAE